jgi:hypothetical protein
MRWRANFLAADLMTSGPTSIRKRHPVIWPQRFAGQLAGLL